MKFRVLVLGLVACGLAGAARAEGDGQRVVITGSSIKRLSDEGALPLQVITAAELDARGLRTAEDLLRQLGANAAAADNATSNNNVFGSDTDRLTGGAANANLRGLGAGSTLVLLNGRRIAAQGMSGGAVDLHTIPMAAVARVEVLKDGASAIYGTDAIGGVINFILRREVRGVELRVERAQPLASGGGTTRRASLSGGFAALDEDRLQVMASLSLDHNDMLRGSERHWARGFQPGRGLAPDSSSHPYANVLGHASSVAGTALGGDSGTAGSTVGASDPVRYTRINRLALDDRCDAVPTGVRYQPQLWNASAESSRYLCNTDYGAQYMLAPRTVGHNLVTQALLALDTAHTLRVELTASRTAVTSELTPSQLSTSNAAGNHYPVGGPHYLDLRAAGVNDFDPTRPIAYRWRMQDFGNRVLENVAENRRVWIGLEGLLGDHDYRLGLSGARAEGWTHLVDGYAYVGRLNDALRSGLINPWVPPGEAQSPQAMALIESTKARGRLQGGRTGLVQFDGALSGALLRRPAGSLDFALGFDLRRETYAFAPESGSLSCNDNLASAPTAADAGSRQLVYNCPANSAVPRVARNVRAVYAELAVPVSRALGLQLALRHDHYSDFGGTTHPKLAFRWQPADTVLWRGALGSGFRAPGFQQLSHNPAARLDTADFADPVLCPTDPTQCTLRLNYTDSGDPALRPERSRQVSFGVVLSPLRGLTLFADGWRVDLEQRIKKLTLSELKQHYALFSDRFVRDGSGRITLANAGWVNAADSSTRGIDWGLSHRLRQGGTEWTAQLGGTRLLSHRERSIATQPLQELVGEFGLRTLYLRDRIQGDLGWARGDWSATLSAVFKSGYADQDLTRYGTARRRVASTTTFNLFGSWRGPRRLVLGAGLRNLFDQAPPFTYHSVDDVVGAGWDPRVADPFGRTLVVSAAYAF